MLCRSPGGAEISCYFSPCFTAPGRILGEGGANGKAKEVLVAAPSLAAVLLHLLHLQSSQQANEERPGPKVPSCDQVPGSWEERSYLFYSCFLITGGQVSADRSALRFQSNKAERR